MSIQQEEAGTGGGLAARAVHAYNKTLDPSGKPIEVGASYPEPNALPSEMGVGGSDPRVSVVNPVQKAVVTADGVVSADPAYVMGVHCNSAVTTSFILHDNDAAASGESIEYGAMTAGQENTHNGLGIIYDTGIYADWTDGEVVVFYRVIN